MRVARLPLVQWVVLLLFVAVALISLSVEQRIHWVGSTDLEIEFMVTDAATNEPIPEATIQIHSEGGLYAERGRQDFVLITGEAGQARRLCKDCMCFGTSGRNIHTFFVHLPEWYYHVIARGYAPSEVTELDIPENVGRVQRDKPAARLIIPIRLRKHRAECRNTLATRNSAPVP